jgi:hypothetical protein
MPLKDIITIPLIETNQILFGVRMTNTCIYRSNERWQRATQTQHINSKNRDLSSTDTGISSFDIAIIQLFIQKLKYQIHLNYILLKPISKKREKVSSI